MTRAGWNYTDVPREGWSARACCNFFPSPPYGLGNGRSEGKDASEVRRNPKGPRDQTTISIADLDSPVPEKVNEDMHGEKAGWGQGNGRENRDSGRWARLGS